MKFKDLIIVTAVNFFLVLIFSFIWIPLIVTTDFKQTILEKIDNQTNSAFKALSDLQTLGNNNYAVLESIRSDTKLILETPLKIKDMGKQIDAIENDTKQFNSYTKILSMQSRNIEEMMIELRDIVKQKDN